MVACDARGGGERRACSDAVEPRSRKKEEQARFLGRALCDGDLSALFVVLLYFCWPFCSTMVRTFSEENLGHLRRMMLGMIPIGIERHHLRACVWLQARESMSKHAARNAFLHLLLIFVLGWRLVSLPAPLIRAL